MNGGGFRVPRNCAVLVSCLLAACGPANAAAPTLAWSVTYNNATNDEAAWGVAVDSSGNIVAAGYETRTDWGQQGYLLVKKYGSNGNLLWTRTDNGNSSAAANGVAIDSSGNILVVGTVDRTGIGQDLNWLIRKYDPLGNVLWSTEYDDPGHGNDNSCGIAVDASGNSVAVGYEFWVAGHMNDWCINKYDRDGNLLWHRTYSNPSNFDATAYGVAADASGNIVVVGIELRNDLGQSYNWLIRKYDMDGALLWSRSYTAPNVCCSMDDAFAVATDASGNVIVAGDSDQKKMGESFNALVRKYDPAGSLLWERYYNDRNNGEDAAFGVVVDKRNGSIIEVGWESWKMGATWLFTRKYDKDGNLLWHEVYKNPYSVATNMDSPNGVAVDASGNIAVAGQISTVDYDWDWIVYKYAELASPSVPSQPGPAPAAGEVWVTSTNGSLPAYPRRGDEVIFSMGIQAAGRLRVKVFSLLWEEVATIFDGNSAAGPLELRWNGRNKKGQIVATGTYLVRFDLPGQKAVIKRVAVGK